MLTEKIATTTPPPETGAIEILDDGPGGQRGLMLRVTPAGARTYAVRYSIAGRRRRKALGRVGEITLRRARTMAAEILAAAATGADPDRANRVELQDLFEGPYADVLRRRLARPDTDLAIWRNHLRDGLLYLTPDQFSRRRYHEMVDRWTAAGLGANAQRSAHRVLVAFWRWLIEREYADAIPFPSAPPAPRRHRERVPSLDEVRAIWGWALTAGLTGDVVRLLILTGLRKMEAQRLTWAEVEGDRLMIDAERMKGRRAHVVPLSAEAQALIDMRRSVCASWSAYVFAAPRTRRRMDDRPMNSNVQERLRASGVAPGVVVHDLRKALVTELGNRGVPPHVLRGILAHAQSDVVGSTVGSVYIRSDFLPERRAALEQWAALVTGEGER
jgi:integrase